MKTLLEQAIIDATDLRDTALKVAENILLERHSEEIKRTIDNLINEALTDEVDMEIDNDLDNSDDSEVEFEDDDLNSAISDDDFGNLEQGDTEDNSFVNDMPLAAADGEKICQCPDEDEEIEIDFTDLKKAIENDSDDMDLSIPGLEEPQTDDGQEFNVDNDSPEYPELNDDDDEKPRDGLDELKSVLEALSVDYETVKTGWAGTPESVKSTEEEKQMGVQSSTELQKRNKELEKSNVRLQEEINKLNKKNSSLKKENLEFSKGLSLLKVEVEKIICENKKLIYKNRVLSNTSLNEQQKNKFVDVISKADSGNEAKVMFETLIETVGSRIKNSKPKESLNRILENRNRSLSVRSDKEEPVRSERMLRLAGIKKN